MTLLPLDIVVVTHNTRAELAACLQSIVAHVPQRLGTVFVVDNASSDGSAAWVREHFPRVTVIALERNVGFAAANNVALRQSSAPLALLLNSDTLVPAGAIDTLAARLEATGSVAAGPRLVDGSGRPEVSFGPMLSPWSEWRQRARVRQALLDSAHAREATRRLVDEERHVDWVTGACLLVRKDAAIRAGLFDERYFMYEEDVDFCAALRAGGGRILFTPAAEVVHLRGRSVARTSLASTAHYDRSHLLFYEKHLPAWAPLLRLWLRFRGRAIR
jgi:GT2 family glycosyltransferase